VHVLKEMFSDLRLTRSGEFQRMPHTVRDRVRKFGATPPKMFSGIEYEPAKLDPAEIVMECKRSAGVFNVERWFDKTGSDSIVKQRCRILRVS